LLCDDERRGCEMREARESLEVHDGGRWLQVPDESTAFQRHTTIETAWDWHTRSYTAGSDVRVAVIAALYEIGPEEDIPVDEEL